jgi:hypothetical protein
MLFEGARSIHTFGMRFAILVAFLDRNDRVLRTRLLPPRRLAWCRDARNVLELGSEERVVVGSLLSPGDREPRTTLGARGIGRRART